MSDTRIALVTGASSGIGAATARQLTAAGFRVFGASRRPPREDRFAIEPVTLDVTDDDSVAAAVAEVLARAGRIDVLVNNAGYLCAGAIEEISLAEAHRQFETNYFGVVRMCLAVLPGMRERRDGHIITISSLAGLVPVPFWGHYNASKFAVEGLIETLRHEVRPFGIHVAMLEPGSIKTPFYTRPAPAGIPDYAGPRKRALHTLADYEAHAPGPDLVARRVVAIANSRHPKLRNLLTREATQFSALRWLLPQRAFETGVRHGFKLTDRH